MKAFEAIDKIERMYVHAPHLMELTSVIKDEILRMQMDNVKLSGLTPEQSIEALSRMQELKQQRDSAVEKYVNAADEISRLRAEVDSLTMELATAVQNAESARVDAEKAKELERILSRAVIVGRSEYSLAMNALRRDAETGNVTRGEIVAEVEKSVNARMCALDAAVDAAKGKDNG